MTDFLVIGLLVVLVIGWGLLLLLIAYWMTK
jgi:hypothetical protein